MAKSLPPGAIAWSQAVSAPKPPSPGCLAPIPASAAGADPASAQPAATTISTAPCTATPAACTTQQPRPTYKRIAEGKDGRDAVRLLKRYLARHLYRVLDNQAPPMT